MGFMIMLDQNGYQSSNISLWYNSELVENYTEKRHASKYIMTNKPLSTEIYQDSIEVTSPRTAKGGTFATADMRLIRDALMFYVKNNGDITDADTSQASNLIHRLGRIA